MKAQSYGKYDVIDDEQAITWEQAEALALRARGKKIDVPVYSNQGDTDLDHKGWETGADTTLARPAERPKVFGKAPPEEPTHLNQVFRAVQDITLERHLLNRALILLIHLRERVFKDNPEVETWVNEILDGVRQGKRI